MAWRVSTLDGVVLSHLEFDLLWEELELGDHPYPLDVRSHGFTMDERDELGGQVFETLTQAGLIDGEDLDPGLEERLKLLATPRFSVDALLIGEVPLRVLAAAGPRDAVLAVLDHAELALRPFPPDQLIGTVAEVAGDLPAGPGGSVRLPRQVFSEAMNAFAARGHSGFEWTLSQAGVSGRATRALSTLAESPRTCSGQLAANGPRGRSPVLTLLDTEAGRYGLTVDGRAGTQWVTVTPADTNWLVNRLAESIDQVR
ncbi:ESX secretion-associated protein EspG [Amycolatopsis cynarae]|uniref:ESX secretion-associated protein EspG n=1 Tax=Amycolatopsis cynarae TaxID=2995223 RepID=A0ABY7B2C1_9PSEU|nr:ESX secretion-associated protein EspG [Amycolatopsis sp. HUAS 11-8]WAL66446.1 ESX secretion-associated protein EspG [Amycolatopsis sp. HUAS 11-8]